MNEKGPSGKHPIFREIDVNRDRDRLLSFDASFTTDRIYHVEVKDMKVKIDVKTLDAPFYKRYPIAPVVFELGSNVFGGTSVLVESGGDIAGFAVMKHEAGTAVLTSSTSILPQPTRAADWDVCSSKKQSALRRNIGPAACGLKRRTSIIPRYNFTKRWAFGCAVSTIRFTSRPTVVVKLRCFLRWI